MVILNCLKELEGMGWCEGFEGCEGCERSYEMVVCDWGMQLKTSTEPIPAFSIYCFVTFQFANFGEKDPECS